MLHGIAGDPSHAIGLPAVRPDRCVHSHTASAGCRACVEACPRHAWTLAAGGPRLDAMRCDGCGLCAPACPEGAVGHAHRVARRRKDGQPVAFAACSRTGLANGRDRVQGVLPCLHVLGAADLAALYENGVRRMVVAHDACAACPTGSQTPMRLHKAAQDLNLLLEARGLPPLLLTRRSPTPWRAYLTFDTEPDPAAEARPDPDEPPAAPGRLLPSAVAGVVADTLPWPWVPLVDAARCSGCGACALACPHDGLRFQAEPPALLIEAEDCTGCQVCTDVCTEDAILVERLAPKRQTVVPVPRHRRVVSAV